MRSLDELSGPWAGWWIQGERRGRMSLRLEFKEGQIRGTGRDVDGGFEIAGNYEGAAVLMLKGYADLTSRYKGTWDGTVVSGHWRISTSTFRDEGPFEIWPEDAEVAMMKFLMAEEEDAALALPGPREIIRIGDR